MAGPSHRNAHLAVLVVALLPLAVLGVRAASGGLSANPIEDVTHVTGEWTLRWLLLALAVTPLRRLSGWGGLAPLRRTCGLIAFGWVCLHLLTYAFLDQYFDWGGIVEDVLERRYITVGFAGFLCLLPLALTSTRASMKRLGKRWVSLHRLAYAAGICGVVHYIWLAKGDRLDPYVYAGVLALLLASRRFRISVPARGGS